MKTITYDFETFWNSTFSLSKISFMEYIQSPEFEVISVSVKLGNGETVVRFGDEVGPFLKSLDWANSAAIAHNGNEFDHPLLVWKYDVHPKMFIDTLALSKAKHQSQVGGSLKALSEAYGLPTKDNSILMSTKGKRYADFDLSEMRDMAQYNKVDTDNCYALFKKFAYADTEGEEDLRDITQSTVWQRYELALSDMTARMIIYPQFVCDTDLLADTLAKAEEVKEAQLLELAPVVGALDSAEVRTMMASAAKFAEALRALGVEPPVKISKTTGKETYALAKTDQALTALLEHEDERVQLITSTRLAVKSTLLETRLATMMKCAGVMNGWMPVPLAYHAATTGRWGGRVWNPQNLPRIPRDKQGNIIPKLSNALRMALCAPEGYRVVVSDLSGIELRVNHYLWDVASTRELYAADPEADLYKEFAAALFGVLKDAVTKDQRQLAKVAQLGLGYGAGWSTFQKVAKSMGGIDLDEAEARRVTETWRIKYVDIVMGWRKCQDLIKAIYAGTNFSPDPRGLVRSCQNGVRLPSGRKLYYPGLFVDLDEKGRAQYKYGTGRKVSKVYSGLMDENIVQAIARDVIAEHALKVQAATGYSPAHMVHDELVYVVPEAEAEAMLATVNSIMRTPPSWLPGIVLWSEGDIACNYGEAK
jgi:DNA polymerase